MATTRTILQTMASAIEVFVIFILLVVVEVKTRLFHEPVHLILIRALVGQIAPVIVFSAELHHEIVRLHYSCIATVIFIIIKHAFKPTLFLFFELVFATEIACSDLDSRLQILSLKAFPIVHVQQLLSNQLIVLSQLHYQLCKSRQMGHIAHFCS